MRGRKPKPTYLKVLDGNAGHRPVNQDEPQPDGDLLEPPGNLSAPEQKVWREAIASAPPGMLRKLDESVFGAWVTATYRLDCARATFAYFAEQDTKTRGTLIKGPDGRTIVNPLGREMRGLMGTVQKLASELGFTPSSRTRVKVSKSDQSKANPFAGLKSLDD